MSLNCTQCLASVYSLAKYADTRPYPIAHVVLPMQFYFVTQNPWATVVAFSFYETITAIERTLCYEVGFCIDEVALDCSGFSYDNHVADIHQGLLGLLLIMLLFVVLDAPRWAPSFRESVQYKLKNIWWRRNLFVALLLGTSLSNYGGAHIGRGYGVGLHAGANALVFLAFYFWNKRKYERGMFWTDPKTGRFARRDYNNLYLGGAGVTTALILSWFLPFSQYTYVNVYIVYAALWAVLLFYGIANGRLAHAVDLHTLGIYSSYMQDETTRFRWNKERYINFISNPTRVPSTVEEALKRKNG